MIYRLRHVALPLEHARAAVVDGRKLHGAHTRILRDGYVGQMIWLLWGREGCCIKVFKQPGDGRTLDRLTWGDNGVPVVEATIVQNLAAMEGLAPRVYALVVIHVEERQYLAQVTDYAEGRYGYQVNDLRSRLSEFVRDNPFIKPERWDMNPMNAVGGLWTDWAPWHLTSPDGYEQHLRELARKHAAWGSRKDPYQDAFGTGGAQRDFESRLAAMELTARDVEGRTLLDIGCNLGNFCRWVEESGARRAWGVDSPRVAPVAREIANWCRAWNVDVTGRKLAKDQDNEDLIREATGWPDTFDVVLALSVERQIGYGRWMREITSPGGLFFLEGHVPDRRETYEDRLSSDWDEVEYLGMTRDHGPRPLFRCRRSK